MAEQDKGLNQENSVSETSKGNSVSETGDEKRASDSVQTKDSGIDMEHDHEDHEHEDHQRVNIITNCK